MKLAPFLVALLISGLTAVVVSNGFGRNNKRNRNKRIIGGILASGKEWPFVAMVETKDARGRWNECSATVISKKHVLTAAHCVVGIEKFNTILIVIRKELQQVKVNTNYDNDIRSFMTIRVKRVVPHPSFNIMALTNDLAVLEADEYFVAEVEPVVMASDFEDTKGQSVLMLGFGDYNVDGEELNLDKLQTSDHLRQVVSYTHSFKKCVEAWHFARADMHICVGSPIHGIATGDSGGPLLAQQVKTGRWMQIGVASFGSRKEDIQGKPHVFMRTSHYCRWLSEVTKNLTICMPFAAIPLLTANEASDEVFLIADISSHARLFSFSIPLLTLTTLTSC